MTTMPTEITYGYVTARIILATGDGADPDRLPDAQPATGTTVKITPKTQIVRLAGASPVLIAKQPITCTLDDDGRLLDPQGNLGVWLVTGVYTVAYSSPSAAIPTHDIGVLEGHTEATPLDLITAMPPGGPVLTASQYAELSARIAALPAGGGGGGAVSSVNGKTGAVTLNAADVSALPSTYTPPAQSWASITGKPSTFTPSAHTHAVADVTGLQSALDGKQPAGSYAPTSHVHTIANVTGLQAALDGKQPAGSYAAASHTHTIADVTGLQTALDTAGAPQTLSLSGQNLSLSGGGGTVTLPSGGGGGGSGTSLINPVILASGKYTPTNGGGMNQGRAAYDNEISYQPVGITQNCTISTLTVQVTTAGTSGTPTLALGLYGDNGGVPGSRIAYGSLNPAVTGDQSVTINTPVTPGQYWVAVAHGGNSNTQLAANNTSPWILPWTVTHTARCLLGVGASLPATATIVNVFERIPTVWMSIS